MDTAVLLSFIIIFYISFKTVSLHFTDRVGIQVSLRVLNKIISSITKTKIVKL
jgi:hypothetical protein